LLYIFYSFFFIFIFIKKKKKKNTKFFLKYDDNITLGVDTNIMINWPKPCIAALPVSISISVLHFSGKVKSKKTKKQRNKEIKF